MTHEQKRRLAAALLCRAGDLIEFWGEGDTADLTDIDSREAAQVLAQWLRHLPGDYWPLCFPDPKR